MELLGPVPLSQLRRFVKPYLLLPRSRHALLYWFQNFACHPAGFVIFAPGAQVCILIIVCLIVPFLLSLGTYKIARTVSNSIQHLPKCFSGFLFVDPAC